MAQFNSDINTIEFFSIINRLKALPRQGWIGKVPKGDIESISDHAYGVAFLAVTLIPIENQLRDPDEKLNNLVCLERAVLHDIGESLYFDIDNTLKLLLGTKKASEIKIKLDEKSESAIQHSYDDFQQRLGVNNRIKLNFYTSEGHLSEEDHFVKFLDLFELYLQTKHFLSRGLITTKDSASFLQGTKEGMEKYKSKIKICKKLLPLLE